MEFEGVKLMKAQLGVPGYMPNLKEVCDSATKVFGGYTKFTPGMIWRAGRPKIRGWKGWLTGE